MFDTLPSKIDIRDLITMINDKPKQIEIETKNLLGDISRQSNYLEDKCNFLQRQMDILASQNTETKRLVKTLEELVTRETTRIEDLVTELLAVAKG